jgi:hypothetical protein
VLDPTRLREGLGLGLPPWEVQLDQVVSTLAPARGAGARAFASR